MFIIKKTVSFYTIKFLTLLDLICSKLPKYKRFRPLRGSFQAQSLLKNHSIEGEFLHETLPTINVPSYSVCKKAGIHQEKNNPSSIFWVRTNDACLVGKTLRWRNHRDEVCFEGDFGQFDRLVISDGGVFSQSYLNDPIMLEGCWTSITSNWSRGDNYYHWMLDSLTRLLVREKLPENAKILLPNCIHNFVKETIELIGLDDEVTWIKPGSYICENYYFCPPLAPTGYYNPLGYDWLTNKFSSYFEPPDRTFKVFLTRRNTVRLPKNIKEIEAILASHGFNIIDAGEHTVLEQIKLISKSTVVVGLHGAAMTNLLWASPNIKVLELFESKYYNACYELIAIHRRQNYNFLTVDNCQFNSQLDSWLSYL